MKRSHLFRAAAAVVLAGALCAQAQADDQLFSFTYNSPLNGVVITGELLGSLQADGNTVLVTQVQGIPHVNGVPAMAVPFVDSIIDVVAETSFLPPLVSLNGAVMDFAACTDASCDDGFGFESSGLFGGPVAALLGSFGNLGVVPYSASEWSMSVVPELDSWALMGLGLATLMVHRRRR